MCLSVCLSLLSGDIYIFIYLCCGSRTFTQGQKYKTRYVKKTRLSAEKNLYLHVVAVIMTTFRGYQFNTPHQPTQLYGFPPSPLLLKYASYITFQITMFIVYTKWECQCLSSSFLKLLTLNKLKSQQTLFQEGQTFLSIFALKLFWIRHSTFWIPRSKHFIWRWLWFLKSILRISLSLSLEYFRF